MTVKHSKGQRVRANRRARREADKDWLKMGEIPEYLKDIPDNISIGCEGEAWHRAPPHVLTDHGDGSVDIDDIKIKEISYISASLRHNERKRQIDYIEEKHADIIGQHGAARKIRLREARKDKYYSLRTLQNYIQAIKARKS